MTYDFKAEFAKKESSNFWRRRFKGTKAQILVPGGNSEDYRALKKEQVVRLINSTDPQVEMALLAEELGCSNVNCADFLVESWNVSFEHWDAYDSYLVDREFYFLIAEEK